MGYTKRGDGIFAQSAEKGLSDLEGVDEGEIKTVDSPAFCGSATASAEI